MPVPPLLFPRLVLKVVIFYRKFRFNDIAYNLGIWIVQKNDGTRRVILIKNLYDTELALCSVKRAGVTG